MKLLIKNYKQNRNFSKKKIKIYFNLFIIKFLIVIKKYNINYFIFFYFNIKYKQYNIIYIIIFYSLSIKL